MDRLGVKATNSKAKVKAKARGVKAKAKDLAPEAKAKAKDTPAGLEAPRGQGRGLEDSISDQNCCVYAARKADNNEKALRGDANIARRL